MRILIDGMGGDYAPQEIVKGAVKAAAEIDDIIVILGPEDLIREQLDVCRWKGSNIEIMNATEVISNDETPAMSVRKKKDSTIVKGMNMIKNGEGDVLISGGSTGALLAAGLVVLGRLKGIKRPAIAAWFPALAEGGSTLLLDCGANVEAKPEYVYQNGIMGSIFVRAIKGIEEPSVKLLNIGAEAGKGDELHKEAFRMLSDADINFVGNIEGRDVIFGGCDIVVTDGFSGNIFLKSSEGMSLAIMGQFKKKLTEGVVAKAGAMLAYSKIKEIKKVFDYSDVGAAPILGLKGAVLKMHGNSTETEVYYAIKKAIPYVNNDVTGMIAEAVSRNNVLSAKKETGGDEEDK